jgi:DNA-binding XRE family transcriptional regulator
MLFLEGGAMAKVAVEGGITTTLIRDLDSDLFLKLKLIAAVEHKTIGLAVSQAIACYLQEPPPFTTDGPPTDKVCLPYTGLTAPVPKSSNHRPKVFLGEKEAQLVWGFMRRKAVTEGKLADQLGISRETLNKILHGKQSIGAASALKLAEVTGLAYDQLFGEKS